MSQTSPWRLWRETIPGLTMKETAKRSGIAASRLSYIERGIAPTEDEARKLRDVLVGASVPAEQPEREQAS